MSHSTTNCTSCGSNNCSCGTSCPPKLLNTCTPGHFYRIDCQAYKATCIPKGFPFWVNAGGDCCEGLHIGTGGTGSNLDRVVQLNDFSGDFIQNPDCSIGIDWDELCNKSEIISGADADHVLVCGEGGVKKTTAQSLFDTTCLPEFADLGTVCGVAESLAVYTDQNGCRKFGVKKASSAQIISAGFHTVRVPPLPENESGFIIPDTAFANPTLFYQGSDFSADAGVDHESYSPEMSGYREAPGLDEAKIFNSRFARMAFTIPCPRIFDVTVFTTILRPSTAEEAFKQQSSWNRRVKFNGSPWLYPFSVGPGRVGGPVSYSALEDSATWTTTMFLPAGNFEVEFFYVAPNGAGNYAKWGANTNLPNFSTRAPSVTLTPRLIA